MLEVVFYWRAAKLFAVLFNYMPISIGSLDGIRRSNLGNHKLKLVDGA